MVPPPLAGVRILELARILAGPWAGQLLADLGADVVKVERPGVGDDTRTWGPPFIPAAAGGDLSAAYFHSTNRGKRSIAADFQTETGRETVRKLALQADIVVENFRVGALTKYGLDHASLSRLHPRLITCSITGFGQTGPYAQRAGYDAMIQAMGGIMDLTGEPLGEPQKTGVAYADILTGTYATVGILAALRRRDVTGIGGHLDMSLLDVQTGVLANQAMNYLVSGETPRRMGNAHPNIVPYQVFATSDGHVMVAVGNDTQFARFVAILGLTKLATDPRFVSNAGRVSHRTVLVPLLAEACLRWDRGPLLAAMEANGIPASPINSVADAFADPQVRARGMRQDLAAPEAAGGAIPGIRCPIVLDGKTFTAERPAPALDAQAAEIMADWANPTHRSG